MGAVGIRYRLHKEKCDPTLFLFIPPRQACIPGQACFIYEIPQKELQSHIKYCYGVTMIVSDFTIPELNYFRTNCNFVGLEIDVFELRSQGITLERIAEELNMSVDGVKRISRKVNNKIMRTI